MAYLIVIDGPIGAGKTEASEILSKRIKNLALVNLDKIKRFYLSFDANPEFGLGLASDIGAAMTKEYLKNKINVLVDKAFTKEQYLNDFIKKSKVKGVKVLIYQLDAPLEIRIARVKQREKIRQKRGEKFRPLTKKKLKKNYQNYETYRYRKAKVFDSSKLSARQIAIRIISDIN